MAIITEEVGDIFDSPPNSILIHACNAKGAWGSGVAVAFKKRFPKAYNKYHSQCRSHSETTLVGTTLLVKPQESEIPPQKPDIGREPSPSHQVDRYVACLYTSHGYGKNVDPPETILKNTRAALDDLATQIRDLRALQFSTLGQCRAVRINSGKFGVPWVQTKQILEEGSLDIVVVRPEAERNGKAKLGKRTRKGPKKGAESGKRTRIGLKKGDKVGGELEEPAKRRRITEIKGRNGFDDGKKSRDHFDN